MTTSAASDRLDETAAAQFAGLHPHHLAQLRVAGTGPRFITIKGAPIYERSAVRDWCIARLRNSTRNSK